MISIDLIEIGNEAKARRKNLGITQAEAAEKIQAHRNEISRIEQGKYNGNITTFVRYLNLLGLSLHTEVSRNPTLDNLDKLFNEDDD
ncbi:MAG: helix-turn-helix transcriptional regulator [Pseudomonadales bacterium]|nr:helix-turn-helix transcriptional regulator [Pseudomonadales bacterium]